jgi:hypothetical protein
MIALPNVAAAPNGDQSNCNNNGIVVQFTVTGDNDWSCDTSAQYCDQGTGAGTGAGAGGPGQNDVSAETGASTDCSQENDSPEQCANARTSGFTGLDRSFLFQPMCAASATALLA